MTRIFGDDVDFGIVLGLNPLVVVVLVLFVAPLFLRVDSYTMIVIGTFITGLCGDAVAVPVVFRSSRWCLALRLFSLYSKSQFNVR